MSARAVARRMSPAARAAAPVLAAATALVAAGVIATAPALAAGSGAAPNLLSMESLFMCTSCHEPLELVQSPQAISEKRYIARLIARGYDRQQVIDAMVGAYGTAVLAKPPASGFDLVVYVLPPLLLLGGIAFLALTLPRWRERSRRAAATPLHRPPPLSEADSDRIDEDLARMI
jgi:cytochrome c-type biogenesis protein CcmH/NrfF